MQIRDNGKEVKFYFATVQPVVFSLPPDFDATGKTFSLAIRAERDVNTPALAEATGTVSAQLVTFSVDTDTQSFLDALRNGVSRAWLEIYVGDEAVLLQRPVSIEPRAGSLEGQPPAPITLYYTAAQTNAAISAAVGAHNSASNAHPGTFDEAGTADEAVATHNEDHDAHPGTFDAAGTASSAIEEHNGDPAAHLGLLLGIGPSPGGVMTGRTNGQGDSVWIEQIGDYMQPVNGDFTAAPGTLYTITLTQNKTIYIEVGGNADFDFGLLVTQGATPYNLTLLPDLAAAILFPDDDVPPVFKAANTPPGIGTANRSYLYRFHYLAAMNVLLANLALAVEVTQ